MARTKKANKSMEDRLMDNMLIVDECWLWQGAKNNVGYGMIRDGDKMRTVHRVAAELAGKIPGPSQIVCHTCDIKHCFNPEHLWIGTHQENTQDMMTKNRNNVTMKGQHYTLISCEHCNKDVPSNVFKRFHGDNCPCK